jgi:hypothetical protein
MIEGSSMGSLAVVTGPALLTNAAALLLLGATNRHHAALGMYQRLRSRRLPANHEALAVLRDQTAAAERRAGLLCRALVPLQMAVLAFGIATAFTLLEATLDPALGLQTLTAKAAVWSASAGLVGLSIGVLMLTFAPTGGVPDEAFGHQRPVHPEPLASAGNQRVAASIHRGGRLQTRRAVPP